MSAAIVDRFIQAQRKRFMRFVDKRLAFANTYSLGQKNLFIFPSSRGWQFILLMVVLWILGTNYQNNLILALAFFMVSVLVVAIVQTFANLSRIEITYIGVKDAYAGEDAHVRFKVRNKSRLFSDAIEFSWFGDDGSRACFCFRPHEEKEISVACFAPKRGVQRLPHLGVQSFFPLGIIRSWTWLNFNQSVFVYPQPLNAPLGLASVVDEEGDGLHPVSGGEDFSGLRQYVPGDALRYLSWKTFARGRGLFLKDFSQNLSQENWLDYASLPFPGVEERLSVLCFWVLHFYQKDDNFGLRLPHIEITPDRGHQHRSRCLMLLAEFGA